MAAKGTEAKERIVEKIQEIFGEDFAGYVDKKIYVWSKENGERVQVCLSMTCPKTPIGEVVIPRGDGGINFEEAVVAAAPVKSAEVTAEEQQKIADLMATLGL